ncbi:MAG TPA: trypco2 family protein [Geminicoccus sp.]|jgi:hypothetical protein|uniref:trypco2 family protein n=1 Tax=Geminicoccus sp. TaxID=2024832 RepID=UPI002E3360A0|nr:trypco2 family protein [Geminicoccus sp.]HEX2524863.1 trypco2 family protein [Geminicoccus sp.]
MLVRIIGAAVVLGLSVLHAPAYSQDSNRIELAEYIENLRGEFLKLGSSENKEKLPIYISPLEIELTVTVEKSGNAGLKIYVVDAGGTIAKSAVQKLKFTVSVGKESGSHLTYNPMTPMLGEWGSLTPRWTPMFDLNQPKG